MINIENKGSDNEILDIRQKHSNWDVCGDKEGNVYIECLSSDGDVDSLILNQDELKTFIAFLQRKIK